MNTAGDELPAPSRAAAPLSCTLEELVERARSLATGGTRSILGITGAPGSGKSTVAQALDEALGAQATRVGMDAFHLANQVLADRGSRDRKGAPDTFDPWGYANLLHRLKSNREPVVYAPTFDRGLEESIGGSVPVAREVPLVITEGNYLLLDADGWRDGRDQIDEVWYLDVADSERQLRLVRRHETFGKPYEEARAWALGSDQSNAEIVDTTRTRADLVINLVHSQTPKSLAQA
ncbi:nucleoside/nucleotide kinase family protein [Arthrobacter sp. ISL-69]|uniref:nucleoside/nucleotide kinase family protein n=1 Tax=Arthrobacter sp. ISL-69 TaxID=2819113 RepID=UPI001BEB89F6|nr:nucleoside/nucleotide kinase family protein [Arthrobacter sp. ISL-69]MBT2534842.1 nucleoside/nucleotide kinase family protein [Arthrobacter sp. ISL-69]